MNFEQSITPPNVPSYGLATGFSLGNELYRDDDSGDKPCDFTVGYIAQNHSAANKHKYGNENPENRRMKSWMVLHPSTYFITEFFRSHGFTLTAAQLRKTYAQTH